MVPAHMVNEMNYAKELLENVVQRRIAIMIDEGVALYDKKNYESALDTYNSALKLAPASSFNLNYSKGIACFFLSKFIQAICFGFG